MEQKRMETRKGKEKGEVRGKGEEEKKKRKGDKGEGKGNGGKTSYSLKAQNSLTSLRCLNIRDNNKH